MGPALMLTAPVDHAATVVAAIRGQGVRSALAFEHRHGHLRFAPGGQGHTQVGAQPVAAIHPRISAEAQARLFAHTLAHRSGVAIGGALVRVVAALPAVKIIVRRLILIGLGPKAFRASPGFHERAVHREVFVVEQPRRWRQRHHLGEKLQGYFMLQESSPVLAERARVKARLLHVHVQNIGLGSYQEKRLKNRLQRLPHR